MSRIEVLVFTVFKVLLWFFLQYVIKKIRCLFILVLVYFYLFCNLTSAALLLDCLEFVHTIIFVVGTLLRAVFSCKFSVVLSSLFTWLSSLFVLYGLHICPHCLYCLFVCLSSFYILYCLCVCPHYLYCIVCMHVFIVCILLFVWLSSLFVLFVYVFNLFIALFVCLSSVIVFFVYLSAVFVL